ncbi:pentatricopeptide repeat-containing protein [Pyrus ussuriensis x Pyrus communis]|uniref:Pentatricopeptide repeat-containing protein n=1 Tax=Pyrus ussuriensis x Pyrus communis TaxID=2448454 RepID=A0A5N5I2V2_9ROSA|nr:pentatricopeptide repeat-containing protein [Pyrus ussuriensis x Pyrus communis]
MLEMDVVSWTNVINGFGRNGCFSEGIWSTYVSVFFSCANLGGWGSIYWGKQIHGHEFESGVIEALALGPDASVQYSDDDVISRG